MALEVDTTEALRRPHQLAGLVRAINLATAHDESSWLEWKSHLDLDSSDGRYSIAKAILGMANRMPDVASVTTEGMGYVVVGVEPGQLHGVVPIDAAMLDDGLAPYLRGQSEPRWSATYVGVADKMTLVITVDGPRWGDPIYSLRKGHNQYRKGTIFVRKHGKTEPADPNDIDLLQGRLVRGPKAALHPSDLIVGVVGAVPLRWVAVDAVEQTVLEMAETRREALVAAATEVERRRRDPLTFDDNFESVSSVFARSVFPLLPEPDRRTFDEYLEEVDRWFADLRDQALETWPSRFVSDDNLAVVRVTATNPNDKNLPDIQVLMHLLGDNLHPGVDFLEVVPPLPSPPRAYGEPTRFDGYLSQIIQPSFGFDQLTAPPYISDTWVEKGSLRIGWNTGDLRPHGSAESDDVHVLLVSYPSDGLIHGTWTATSKGFDGLVSGQLTIPVEREPIDIIALF